MNVNVIEILNEYRMLEFDIEALRLRIKECDLRGVIYDDMPKGNDISSSVENTLLLIEKLEKEIEYLEIRKAKIDNWLNVLAERDRNIIKMRFIERLPISELTRKMDLTDRQLRYLRARSIKVLEAYAEKYKII